MAAYSMATGRWLALVALVFAAGVITWAARRRLLSLRSALAALGCTTLGVSAGLLAAVAAGALVSLGLGRPLGWFSSPGLVVPAFGVPAAAGTIAIHALWRRRARTPRPLGAAPGRPRRRPAFLERPARPGGGEGTGRGLPRPPLGPRRCRAPVEIELRGTDGARASAPGVEAVLRSLPPWVTASAYSVRTLRLKI
jgi:hypothetical protein